MQIAYITVLLFLQAARAALSAAIATQQQAQPEESRDSLPAFGSGIQFRPTKKVKQQGSTLTAQRPGPTPTLVLKDEDEHKDGSDDEDMQPVSKPALVSLVMPHCQYCMESSLFCFQKRRKNFSDTCGQNLCMCLCVV